MSTKHTQLLISVISGALFALSFLACSSEEATGTSEEDQGRDNEEGAPIVEEGEDRGLVFTWIDEEGHFKVAQDRSAIPEDHRQLVRVQDPSNPPQVTKKVWVADLRSPSVGKRFAVRQMGRSEFEGQAKQRRPDPVAPAVQDAGTNQRADVASSPRVVMYMTSTCPVCRRARSWLTEQGVSFVERNIQRDPAAARELQEKARRLGVPTDGVPIFEIGDRLIPGFDQRALSQAIGG